MTEWIIKKERVTYERFVFAPNPGSSSPAYWDRDVGERKDVVHSKSQTEVIEEWRVATDVESVLAEAQFGRLVRGRS